MRQQIIETARSYLGWGWRHQARGPDKIDCVGLPILIARRIGMVPEDFDVTGYSRHSELQKLVDIFREHMIEKSRLKAIPGDLVITRDYILPCHCGILGEKSYGLSLIHARASIGRGKKGRGIVREEVYKPEWYGLTTHCFAFRGAD